MGKYAIRVNGEFRDMSFRNKQTIPNSVYGPSHHYSLYVGDEFWGTVWDMHGSWTAVADKAGQMNLVEGFATRRDAAFYITKYMQSGDGCTFHNAEGEMNVPPMA